MLGKLFFFVKSFPKPFSKGLTNLLVKSKSWVLSKILTLLTKKINFLMVHKNNTLLFKTLSSSKAKKYFRRKVMTMIKTMNNVIFSVFPSELFVDLCLYQYGWEKCRPSHSFGPISRDHYLFHYVISGTGTLMAEDSHGITQNYEVKPQQGFMIFPGQSNMYAASNDSPWEYIWIEFDGLRVKEAIEATGLCFDRPIYRSRSNELQQCMLDEMNYIVHHKDAPSFHLIGHLYLFLDYLTRSITPVQPQVHGKLRDFYLKEAISFIECNFQNNISIEDIAQNCGLNRSYFGKIFKDTFGKSPQEFLINYRMIKATELLRLTKLSVQEIGNAVGYPNPLHFSRAFKNVYGISPRAWRIQKGIMEQ